MLTVHALGPTPGVAGRPPSTRGGRHCYHPILQRRKPRHSMKGVAESAATEPRGLGQVRVPSGSPRGSSIRWDHRPVPRGTVGIQGDQEKSRALCPESAHGSFPSFLPPEDRRTHTCSPSHPPRGQKSLGQGSTASELGDRGPHTSHRGLTLIIDLKGSDLENWPVRSSDSRQRK